MLTVDELLKYYKINEDKELAEKLNTSPASISKWRKLGVPAIREREIIQRIQESGNPNIVGNNNHIDIHNGHVTREPESDYGIKPIERELLDDWRGLSEVGQMRAWTYIKQVKAEEGK